uniref:L-ascorbate oxidase homolog n=2 Tax=Cucumis melo TaxID=3656 RepID=A0A9I9DMZ4_CUCME
MREGKMINLSLGIMIIWVCCSLGWVNGEDPYRYYTFQVTYGTRAPLGVAQKVILVNGQFPAPKIECATNDNIIVNVINKLDEPFLFTWSGVKQRRTSWQDGVLGTNCPIPPNSNWTYKFQVKDQIGTFTYFPSINFQRASGGFGAFVIQPRSVITTPYPLPHAEIDLLIGDWYDTDHKTLRKQLDSGVLLPLPKRLLINGQPSSTLILKKGLTYKLRISNVGIATSINFRIQGHLMTLVEVEGAHTVQDVYESLDIHPGQSAAVLVSLNRLPKDYYFVVSSRFTKPILTTVGILRYEGSSIPPSKPLPIGPTYQLHWSMKQARTIRLNLTANAARPNPQGSFHYGNITVVRRLILKNSLTKIKGAVRCAVNNVSYVDPPTPLKLADWFKIGGVFDFKTFTDIPTPRPAMLGVSVVNITLHDFVEIVFQNDENTVQAWHFDGTSFYVVGYGSGDWSYKMRKRYNLVDGISRHTVQVYPRSWTAILVSLDNKGMWNLRSTIWWRNYLGQQLYVRVWNDEKSLYTEADIPLNALKCGKASKY